MNTPPTKERILDAAEDLFAAHGYDATSLRAVTRAADVNLAAVHYHFGNKTRLYQAVFERRVGSINAERLRKLDEAEALAGAEPVPLEALLEAFLEPPLCTAKSKDPGHARFLQIVGRANSATGDHVRAIQGVFQPVIDRFLPALQRALPHLAPKDVIWRFHFVIGSMCTFLVDPSRIMRISEGLCDSDDPEEVLRQLVAFAAGAFRAAPAQVAEEVGG